MQAFIKIDSIQVLVPDQGSNPTPYIERIESELLDHQEVLNCLIDTKTYTSGGKN